MNKLGKSAVAFLGDGKNTIVIKVVDISPHSVDGDFEILILLHDELPDMVSHPAEATLLPAEGPHWWHRGVAREICILYNHVIGLGASEEVLLN